MVIIFFILGLLFLIKSASWLVDGASSLAAKYKVPPLVIGLTIVAFGTSFPELVVNVFASYQHKSDIVIGNVIGSNIANILLILGISAIITPLRVKSSTIWKEIPLSLFASIIVLILAADTFFANQTSNNLSRADSLILVSFFVIFLYYLASLTKKGNHDHQVPQIYTTSKTAQLILGGFIGLFIGGKWVVDNATQMALDWGISDRVISLTIVSIGTSFPELVTSAIAAFKKKTDISIGNIVGSNIFNIFWILPISVFVHSVPVHKSAFVDINVLIAASIAMFVGIFIGKKFYLTKVEGSLFLASYIVYIGYLVFAQ